MTGCELGSSVLEWAGGLGALSVLMALCELGSWSGLVAGGLGV